MQALPNVRLLYTVGVLAGSLALLGCPKQPELAMTSPGAVGAKSAESPATITAKTAPRTSEVPVARPAPPAEIAVTPAPAVTPAVAAGPPLRDVFFNFDDAMIRADQRTALKEDFAWLKAHPEVKLTIAGHCDERGTEEYNLALGERRAQAVKDYLVAEGIAADRINTISYGKDRPFALGHDEHAWQLNRRDHMAMAR